MKNIIIIATIISSLSGCTAFRKGLGLPTKIDQRDISERVLEESYRLSKIHGAAAIPPNINIMPKRDKDKLASPVLPPVTRESTTPQENYTPPIM
jgi:hypothetical protein